MPDLYDAKLDGFNLEIETIDDAVEKAIVRHEYPYKNGALLEDMGQKARVTRFRCYFWDDGADHVTYDTHMGLLGHLEGMEISELVHPKYGQINGRVESVSVHQDDRDRTAQLDICFVEQLILDSDDKVREDVEAAAEESYLEGIDEQEQEFSDDVSEALGPEAPGILSAVLDPALGIVAQFQGVSLKARAYLKTIEAYVGFLEATLNTIANPANSLISIIHYGTSLPGRVIGSLARCLERYALLYSTNSAAPARFIGSMIAGSEALAVSSGAISKTGSGAGFGKTTTIAAGSYVALRAAYLYKADEKLRSVQKKNEGRSAFDARGKYTPAELPDADLPGSTMTVEELESSLAAVRTYLQAAIDLSRQSTSLKKQALQLQTHVSTIKLEREKVIQVNLDNPMPLHLVCLRYGLPYMAAGRLLTINAIRNPNCTAGEVNVYAG